MSTPAKPKTKPKPYNPPWLSLLVKIANSWDDFDRSLEANQLDKQVHYGIVGTLMLGKPLTPKQQSAFLESIRRRVPFKSDFQFTGTIALSRKQREYARKSGIAQSLKDKFDQPVSGQRDINKNDLEQLFSTNSPRIIMESPTIAPINYDFANVSSWLASYTGLKGETRLYAGIPAVNEPVDTGSLPASPLHHTGTTSPDGLLVLNSASPNGIRGNADSDELEEEPPFLGYLFDWQRREANAREEARHRAQMEAIAEEQITHIHALQDQWDRVYEAVWPSTSATKMGLWHEPGKSLTGDLAIGDDRFFLNFRNYHRLDRNYTTAHSYGEIEQLWYDEFWQLDETVDLQAYFAQHSSSSMPDFYEFAISPLYQWKAKGMLGPLRTIARAYYGINGSPERIVLVHGGERIEVRMKPNTSSKAKAPHFIQR